MHFYKNTHKETRFIFLMFSLITIIILATRSNSLYEINSMNTSIKNIFDNPFQVSNATLEVRGEIYLIHRDMKDVVLSESESELVKCIDDVNLHEKHVYHYLSIIRNKVNDEKGKQLELQARKLFRDWKPIRDEVIGLVKNNKRVEAIAITKGKGANQVLELERATLNLDQYARHKADLYRHNAEVLHRNFFNENIFIAFSLLFLLIFITYYTVTRISIYMSRIEHLTDVLSVIREINRLIVREKDKKKLVQEICSTLVTNQIYGNAWIALFNDSKEIEYIASADDSENFVKLKKKLESGWVPPCISMINVQKEGHIVIDNTMKSCPECPFTDIYESKGAYSIQLKFNEKVYGSLTLSINSKYLKEKDELSLLDEVAGDIAYALSNYENEEIVQEHTTIVNKLRDLYSNIVDSIDNMIFVKDTNFNYIVCNNGFERFVGRSKEDIIGKSDYDLFDKNIADFFRSYDQKMFDHMQVSSNFEWVTYPDGEDVYLFTVKSPLIDSKGNILGLVGNAVDFTERKHMEDELLASNDKFKKAFNNTPSLILITHFKTGVIYEINQKFESKTGYKREELIGKNVFDINIWSNTDERKDFTDTLQQYETIEGKVYTFHTKNRQEIIVRIYVSLIEIESEKYILAVADDITEEIQAHEELKKSQEKYHLLADNALDLIWKMNMNLEFTYVNPAVETLLGYPVHEFVGTNLDQHCSQPQFEQIEAIATEMLRTNTNEGVSLEAILHKKDGSEIPLEVNGKIIFDETRTPIGFQGSARDFTVQTEARTKLNDALIQLEKKSKELQTILQEAPNPIMLHNEAGEVLMINKVWEDSTGYKYDEINTIEKWTQKACNKKSLLKEQNAEALYSIDKKTNLGENIITSKDGHEMIWQVSSAPLGIINGKRTIVTSAMDVTEIKKKDEMMMAQSRHAAMGEMIGMIAHQWRQPIASIAMDANNMLLDIAFETFDDTSAAEYTQDILDQTNHLSKTIDDFRNFFKPDKSVSSVKLESIMEETLAIVKESLANHTIALKTSYMSNTLVNAFPRELMQVFVNIINNAKDSLLDSHTQNALIEIKVYDEEEYVCTEICDNGGGIDAAIMPKIFYPYFSTKDEKTGTGLGLYMSKMIVEEHLHGFIEASNNKDGGACFKIRLLKNYETDNQEI